MRRGPEYPYRPQGQNVRCSEATVSGNQSNVFNLNAEYLVLELAALSSCGHMTYARCILPAQGARWVFLAISVSLLSYKFLKEKLRTASKHAR